MGGDGREGSERERDMEKEGEMVMKVGGERRGGREGEVEGEESKDR